jgi:hypothetical protein
MRRIKTRMTISAVALMSVVVGMLLGAGAARAASSGFVIHNQQAGALTLHAVVFEKGSELEPGSRLHLGAVLYPGQHLRTELLFHPGRRSEVHLEFTVNVGGVPHPAFVITLHDHLQAIRCDGRRVGSTQYFCVRYSTAVHSGGVVPIWLLAKPECQRDTTTGFKIEGLGRDLTLHGLTLSPGSRLECSTPKVGAVLEVDRQWNLELVFRAGRRSEVRLEFTVNAGGVIYPAFVVTLHDHPQGVDCKTLIPARCTHTSLRNLDFSSTEQIKLCSGRCPPTTAHRQRIGADDERAESSVFPW